MTTDTATERSMSRFLRFARGAVGLGLAFAVGVGAVAAVLKWLVGGQDVSDAMVEAVAQGFPLLGFILGGAVASARALYEISHSAAYRFGVSIALGTAFLLVWTVLAVGGIGAGGPPDLVFAGVLAVGFIGAIVARFEAPGMARAMVATALALALAAVIALAAGWHRLPGSSVLEIVLYCGFFAALFTGSAALFHKAAREPRSAGAGPEG